MNTNRPYILIVDDEKGLRIGTQRLLESENFNVDTAENGTEGIRLGISNDYDLAMIDMKMPDIDGLEVLKEIKKEKPNTVCFIVTAFASYDTAIEATRMGAYSYIPKPFTPEELIHQLEKGYNQRVLTLESERLKKEREERLLELAGEKSRLRTIINSINGGVVVINKSGEVVYFNNAALKYLDIDELTLGQQFLDKIPTEAKDLVNKHLNSEKVVQKSYTTQIEMKPGELYFEIVCSPVLNSDETLSGVVMIIRNISQLKKIELIKSQFVSMVAHELKTPLAAVQGFLGIILDKSIPIPEEKHDEYLSRSVVRLKGLLDLVNDLLDISRMELKTKNREIENLNLKEIVDSTVQFLEFESKEKGVEILTDIEKGLPGFQGDQNEIIRVYTNLLSNAIKYNKENGKVYITIYTNNNYIVSEIKDTGIGLKEKEQQRLFQEFFRAKNENTRGISGTGLGLTIVRRLIDCYHGKIEVTSEYGVGTTFTIYLPKSHN